MLALNVCYFSINKLINNFKHSVICDWSNDIVDSHVRFISAEENEYFEVKQDKTNPQKIKIYNTKAIEGSITTYVTFTCDFTDVPVGYTVTNSVGGNTTRTTKKSRYSAKLNLEAQKLIDGGIPTNTDSIFEFTLTGEGINQTKNNGSDGSVVFDTIYYSNSDIGKTFTYQVKETKGNDLYTYDDSIYTVEVTPTLSSDSNTVVELTPIIKKNNQEIDKITFNNTRLEETISIEG